MEKYDVEVEVEVDDDGTVRFYKPGTRLLHRLNGPAVEWASGTKHWYIDGNVHRTDGPAAEYADGSKFWFVNGKQHRLDGPAIEWANGSKYWYIDGVKLTKKQFKKKTAPVAKELTIGDIEKLLGHKVKVIS